MPSQLQTARSEIRAQDRKPWRKEYARHEGAENVHTNTVESISASSSVVIGSFHHVSRKQSRLYLAEFDHRYNHRKSTDGERTVEGLKKATGKRLTYKPLTRKIA